VDDCGLHRAAGYDFPSIRISELQAGGARGVTLPLLKQDLPSRPPLHSGHAAAIAHATSPSLAAPSPPPPPPPPPERDLLISFAGNTANDQVSGSRLAASPLLQPLAPRQTSNHLT
jgi:hypothetical protein